MNNDKTYFVNPTSKTKVRNGVYAYRCPNGCINIQGEQYHFYTMAQAIKLWRSKH